MARALLWSLLPLVMACGCGKSPVSTPTLSARKPLFQTPIVDETTSWRIPAVESRDGDLLLFIWVRPMLGGGPHAPFQAFRDGTVIFRKTGDAEDHEGQLTPEALSALVGSVRDRVRGPDLRMYYGWTDQTITYIFVRDGAEWIVASAPSARPLFFDGWPAADRRALNGFVGTAPHFDDATRELSAAALESLGAARGASDRPDADRGSAVPAVLHDFFAAR